MKSEFKNEHVLPVQDVKFKKSKTSMAQLYWSHLLVLSLVELTPASLLLLCNSNLLVEVNYTIVLQLFRKILLSFSPSHTSPKNPYNQIFRYSFTHSFHSLDSYSNQIKV